MMQAVVAVVILVVLDLFGNVISNGSTTAARFVENITQFVFEATAKPCSTAEL